MLDEEDVDPRDLTREECCHRDAEPVRRLRKAVAWLGEHGAALDEALNQIPGETLVPALRHLARIVRQMGVEPRLSPELRAALDEMGLEPGT